MTRGYCSNGCSHAPFLSAHVRCARTSRWPETSGMTSRKSHALGAASAVGLNSCGGLGTAAPWPSHHSRADYNRVVPGGRMGRRIRGQTHAAPCSPTPAPRDSYPHRSRSGTAPQQRHNAPFRSWGQSLAFRSIPHQAKTLAQLVFSPGPRVHRSVHPRRDREKNNDDFLAVKPTFG